MLDIKQVTLEGKYVLLRPPSINDFDGLPSAAQDGEIWNSQFALFPTVNEMSEYLLNLIKEEGQQEKKTILSMTAMNYIN